MKFSCVTVPRGYLLPFLAITLFIVQLGLCLGDLPSLKLMQQIVYKSHYGATTDEPLPEEDCLVDAVQQELNCIIMGTLISVTVGGALVSFPLGILANRIGRVPVLAMSIFGLCISQAYTMYVCWQWRAMPLKAIWGLGAVLLLGGGRSVAEAMVFTIISDVVPGVKRATWFQLIVAALLTAQLVSPLISVTLLKTSTWTPLFLSLGLILFGGFLVIFTPETLPSVSSKDSVDLEAAKPAPPTLQSLKHLVSAPCLLLLPGAVWAIPLTTIQSDLFIRLMPVQFDWSLNQSAVLVSPRSLTTLTTLCLVLPVFVLLFDKFASGQLCRLHHWLARGSALPFVTGSVCLTMIASEKLIVAGLIISALGSGLPTLCRAMLVTAMGGERTGSVFGVLAVGEVIGFLAFELAMGSLFGVGLRTWMGLPFCLGVVLAFGIGVTTWMVPVPRLEYTES
ncbi:putative MFS transporter [Dactylonectria estremocensis]|uniref:MFS transporter n=1 Tax=Dactylonectria estremocensis TaxID=1079267 RepID=A0A9P9F0P9_9HYPO|nr:putative MFS transporter [Dactylonectria estremocensis]